ncbi:hypothetical protein [Streptomyces sp. NPDC020965]|uniref:hypothetical protein n=1 Tax=Streptomyces sp. NPDC020965 TaxID=3365105 RepID=UPI0037B0D56D
MESKRRRIALWAGLGVLVVGAPATVYGVVQDQEAEAREAVERATLAIMQQRADLSSAVAREERAPVPRGMTADLTTKLGPHYAEIAKSGRAWAAKGEGWREAEVELVPLSVDLIDDSATIRFHSFTHIRYEDATVEGSDQDTPALSMHSFAFVQQDGEWRLGRDRTQKDINGVG